MKLAFRLGNIPVRVQLSFLIMMVIFRADLLTSTEPRLFLVWLAVVFVSILVHELGHALMGKAFGLTPEIELHGMGGTTSWSAGRALSNGRSILVSLAGPVAGMLFGLIGYAIDSAGVLPNTVLAKEGMSDFLYVNIGWGAFNLVRMLPLDGGNVMRSTLNAITGGRGEKPSRIVSIVMVVPLVAVAFFYFPGPQNRVWFGLLGALFAYQNYRALTEGKVQAQEMAWKPQLDAAYDALKHDDGKRVLALVQPVLVGAKSSPVRAEALHLAAYGFLLEHRPADADRMIAMLPPGYAPHPEYTQLRARTTG